MRVVVTVPVIVLLQCMVPEGKFGSVPAQTPAKRELMIAGLAKPMDTWYPAGPYSWKYDGSPIRRNESCAFWPSRVFVCSHSSPLAMRSAAGVATTPYLPCIMLGMTAWPANGDGVAPSASNSGQVTILPVMPIVPVEPGALPFDVSIPTNGFFVIGQASRPLRGSMVPAKVLESGWLNMSCVNCPVASPVPPASS